jgi:hypothetical protein
MDGHVICMGEMRNTKYWLKNLKGRDHMEDLVVNGKIIRMDLTEMGWKGSGMDASDNR